MLEKFLGLKIKGRCFEQETELKFFSRYDKNDPGDQNDKGSPHVSLVFGRNGSGKTTVSRTFAQIAKDAKPLSKMDVSLISRHSKSHHKRSPALTLQDIQHKTLVFNEDYVLDKIAIKSDPNAQGLGTIVLLGKQKDLDARIGVLNKRNDILSKSVEERTELKKRLEAPEDPESPISIYQKIKTTLMNPGTGTGWSYRDKSIRRKPRAVAMTKEHLRTVINCTGGKSKEVNIETFTKKLAEHDRLIEQDNLKHTPIAIGSAFEPFDEDGLVSLLNKRFNDQMRTEHEQHIVEAVARLGFKWFDTATDLIRGSTDDRCPFCQHPLSPKGKKELLASLDNVLDVSIKAYRNKLNLVSFPRFDIFKQSLAAYNPLNLGTVTSLNNLIDKAERITAQYREDIRHRLDDVFGETTYKDRGLKKVLEKLLARFKELKSTLHMREMIQERIHELEQELDTLNDKLAKKEIIEDYTHYQAQCKTQATNIAKLTRDVLFRDKCQKQIDDLRTQQEGVQVASDRINAALAYIFMSRNRIRLVPDKGVYRIESNGNAVAPNDISVGERNALALCYFFSTLLDGNEETRAYADERLIILDDPVSSFDHENKMGVLSYVMFEIENLTTAQVNTRIVCLMHELYSFLALATFIRGFNKKCKDRGDKEIIPKLLVLDARQNEEPLKDLGSIDSINEYKRNFDDIYKYAVETPKEANIHIGNQTRRILEAFSTFVFRQGIDYLFLSPNLIKGEYADTYHTHFKARFSRFVVNDESHEEGRIRSLENVNSLFPFIKASEKQNAVRDAICLIYLIMPEHILSLFDRDETNMNVVKSTIDGWLKDIRDSTPLTGEKPA